MPIQNLVIPDSSSEVLGSLVGLTALGFPFDHRFLHTLMNWLMFFVEAVRIYFTI
jgi:hypothetical protein